MKRKTRNTIEELGWEITEYDDGTVELSQYSPAGEDFSFVVDGYNIEKSIDEYAENFDVDEHIEMWVNARSAGNSGIPSVRELVKDADELQEMLNELANALNPRKTIREQVAIYSDAFTLISCCGLMGFFSNTRVSEVNLPNGLYAYEFCGDGEGNNFCALGKIVSVNFTGTFITDVEMEFDETGFIVLSEDDQPNFDCGIRCEFDDNADGYDGIYEWFKCNPNNASWKSPLSFEIKGLSTTQAFMLRDAISEAINSVLDNNSSDIRSIMPQDNLGIVRWSCEDVFERAQEIPCSLSDASYAVNKLDNSALLRAACDIQCRMSSCVIEDGWYVVESAIKKAVKKSPKK